MDDGLGSRSDCGVKSLGGPLAELAGVTENRREGGPPRQRDVNGGVMIIAPYDSNWPDLFKTEAELLRSRLSRLVVRIEHVGSTSVSGLDAKPIIDIQVSVPTLQRLEVFELPLTSLGYAHVPDPDPEFERIYPHFRKPAKRAATHHVHLCVASSDIERRHLAFRDYLRDHRDVAQEYGRLKHSLAARYGLQTRQARQEYTSAKGPFIEKIVAKALAAGYPGLKPQPASCGPHAPGFK